MKCLQLMIDGKVENTGFRFYVYRSAITLGIKGSVKVQNGRVIIEAEGEDAPLNRFGELCRKGPEGSRVEKMQSIEMDLTGYEEFRIL